MQTAILFLIFNRPKPTRRLFEAISEVRPPHLYIGADGPRSDHHGEKKRCEEVRIAMVVDWPCEVKKLFREANLVCRTAVSAAIDWFFDQEEDGDILEDDCVPDQSWFLFAKELLYGYRDNMLHRVRLSTIRRIAGA